MSLNVYTIKHPLVLNWVNYLNHNEMTTADKYYIINKIGISLIYEAARKSIKLNTLYLKQLDKIVEVNILPQALNNLIFTDMYLCQILSKDIINILPLSRIYPISNSSNNHSIFLQKHNVEFSQGRYNIIIIKEDINPRTIIDTIEQIIAKYAQQEKISNIQICCIRCKTSTLQLLGNRYPNLNIYTTQILNDNNN